MEEKEKLISKYYFNPKLGLIRDPNILYQKLMENNEEVKDREVNIKR